MKQKLIAGNWKMNGGLAANKALLHELPYLKAFLSQHLMR
jgi:triosephosphate isomerase